MDSVSQFALGAACGVAALGRREPVWKAALIGGLCGTLPDLDAFIDHGDPVSNMTLHRSDSHALFWLSLASLPIAALVSRIAAGGRHLGRWWLGVWLALVTHPLLDLMTVYGTQLARPFTDTPFAVGSVFIIDPLYTVPLLVGTAVALARRGHAGLRWNTAGLVLSTVYLAWSMVAQQIVSVQAGAALAAQGLPHERVLVTPTAFNTLLWRIVAVGPEGYHEGFRSLFDGDAPLRFTTHASGRELAGRIGELPAVRRMTWFTRGVYKLEQRGDRLLVTDLRMGQEPAYTFSFWVARDEGGRTVAIHPPVGAGGRPADLGAALRWLWRRMWGEQIDPPR